MDYFGPYVWWNHDPDEEVKLVPTPVGQKCLYCEEAIQEGDLGIIMPHCKSAPSDESWIWELAPWHRECHLRQVIGSLAHQQGKCTYVGECNHLGDPSLSKRQEAISAVDYFMKHNFKRPQLTLVK